MDAVAIRFLYGYERWVTRRLLATAAQIPADRLSDSFGMSFDTIPGTLGHILSGQMVWLSRWLGAPLASEPDAGRSEGLSAIREEWRRHDEELDAFLAELTPERLQQPFRFTHRTGKSLEMLLWQSMVHVVNHGTHHRSEVADMLTRLGFPPEETGLTWYIVETTGQL